MCASAFAGISSHPSAQLPQHTACPWHARPMWACRTYSVGNADRSLAAASDQRSDYLSVVTSKHHRSPSQCLAPARYCALSVAVHTQSRRPPPRPVNSNRRAHGANGHTPRTTYTRHVHESIARPSQKRYREACAACRTYRYSFVLRQRRSPGRQLPGLQGSRRDRTEQVSGPKLFGETDVRQERWPPRSTYPSPDHNVID